MLCELQEIYQKYLTKCFALSISTFLCIHDKNGIKQEGHFLIPVNYAGVDKVRLGVVLLTVNAF